MQLRQSILLAAVSLLSVTHAAPVSTEQVLRCTITDAAQQAYLESSDLDIWSHGISANSPTDIRVKNAAERSALLATGISCETFIEDLAALISEEQVENRLAARQTGDSYFSNYQSYAAIRSKIQSWKSTYPDYFTDLGSIGKSIEGRDIPAFKITNNKSTGPKKSIYFNGLIHAREWISGSTTMYQAHKLLTLASTDAQVKSLLDQFEFYVTPVSNPDGYEFSRTSDRMWRKNRRVNRSSSCKGVDLNRNFDEHWGVAGTSSSPCQENYRGTAAFSEPETQAIKNFVLSLPNRAGGIDIHSYGQLVLRPWGWTATPSSGEAQYKRLGDSVQAAIRAQSGVSYQSIPGADLYPASGATDDWMTAKAKMAGFTIELRDEGRYGFVLPANQIVPTGEEIWAGVKAFAEYLAANEMPDLTIPPRKL
ncbi:hypothetical protein BC832DRAFT_228024 [Gaertneriomyces semiglobifer]|nr:hypothetical protein BC832DRAFT_228024 [Gaertneriomyces semiglobifer]